VESNITYEIIINGLSQVERVKMHFENLKLFLKVLLSEVVIRAPY